MLDNFKELFTQEVSADNIIWLILLVLGGILVVYFFYILVKACFMVESQSGRPSHTLIKTIIIALVPTVYGALVMFIPEVETFPLKYIVIATIGMCVIVFLWNLITYGIIGGVMFSIMHIVFGAFASLGILALVFVGIILIVMFFFGGTVASGGTSGGSVPSEITDMNTGETFHVSKGANGEYYVERNGSSFPIRNGDYSGEFLDSSGNRYRTSYDSDNAC